MMIIRPFYIRKGPEIYLFINKNVNEVRINIIFLNIKLYLSNGVFEHAIQNFFCYLI